MTGDQAVTRLRVDAGFDVTDAKAKEWLQDRLNQLVAQSRWRGAQVPLGTTVADDGTYAIPANVVDLELVYKTDSDSAIFTYVRKGQRDLIDLRAGLARVTGSGNGFFAPDFETDGDALIELWPAPDTTGETLTGYGAIEAAAITDWTVAVAAIPADMHSRWVAGAIADALEVGEQRSDLAASFEQKFQEAITMLQRRKNSRVGSGPIQAPVAGRHF